MFNTWAELETHDYQAAVVDALDRKFPEDPPTFMRSVPHGYAQVAAVVADLAAAGLACETQDRVELTCPAADPLEIAFGYCAGTPLRAELDALGALDAAVEAVAAAISARLGPRTVQARMVANVFSARAPGPVAGAGAPGRPSG